MPDTTQTVVALYFIGRDAEDAVQNSEPYAFEKSAQEDALDGEKIFVLYVPVSSSGVQEIPKY